MSPHIISGGRPALISTRAWWSFPTGAAREADMRLASQDKYHFDLDDWRMLKFFFYLNGPVDTDSGPHMYVRGSQRRRIFKHQATLLVGHRRMSPARYGAENATTLTGPGRARFRRRPVGFHMGTRCEAVASPDDGGRFGVSPPSVDASTENP